MREKRVNIEKDCLEVFVKHGLYEATNRVICNELNMVQSNIYTYFKTRDEMVVICTKIATKRLSDNVFIPAIKDMLSSGLDFEKTTKRIRKMIPTMTFMLQVYMEEKYKSSLVEIIERESEMYREYARKKARGKEISEDKINRNIVMLVTAITNYMIFSDESFLRPMFNMVIDEMNTKSA